MKQLIMFVFLGFCSNVLGATYTATSCTQAAVQAAINSEKATPADGDIISIPSGSCTWTGSNGISATFTYSVTIQGAGAEYATSGGSSTAGSDVTVITDNLTGGTGDFNITTTSGKSFRFTGIALLQNSSSKVQGGGMLSINGSSTAVRVDHCHFYSYVSGNKDLQVNSNALGVADHNYYDALASIVTNDIAIYNGVVWGGLSDPQGYGNSSWADTSHFGTSQFFYAEDSLFNNGWVGDCSVGGRYVIRYSTATVAAMANHGISGSAYRSCRAAEVYQNNFNYGASNLFSGGITNSNGGAFIVWGNTTARFEQVISLSVERQSNVTYSETAPPNGWGYCGTAQTGVTSVWDQDTNNTGYACIDQPGRGKGDLITGAAFPSIVDSVTGTQTWPNQALDPVYVWDNTYSAPGTGSDAIVGNSTTTSAGTLLADNRDYYQQFGTYGESGSFNGTKGVGQGLLSARPATCTAGPGGNTPGVGYWATDTDTLYVCNPTNTWTAYYTPYTYPHPLTSGGDPPGQPAAPTNLLVTVH